MRPCTGKVCIYVTINRICAIWLKTVAFVLCPFQIPYDVFDSQFVDSFWVSAEPSTLVHRKGDIQMCCTSNTYVKLYTIY
jgi:hypothetical protein